MWPQSELSLLDDINTALVQYVFGVDIPVLRTDTLYSWYRSSLQVPTMIQIDPGKLSEALYHTCLWAGVPPTVLPFMLSYDPCWIVEGSAHSTTDSVRVRPIGTTHPFIGSSGLFSAWQFTSWTSLSLTGLVALFLFGKEGWAVITMTVRVSKGWQCSVTTPAWCRLALTFSCAR